MPQTSLQTPESMGHTEVEWPSPVYMTSVLVNKVKLDSLTHRENMRTLESQAKALPEVRGALEDAWGLPWFVFCPPECQ